MRCIRSLQQWRQLPDTWSGPAWTSTAFSSLARMFRVAVIALAAALVLPAAAQAATLGLDQRCYVTGETASISGSGFVGGQNVTLSRDGQNFKLVPTDASGSMHTKFEVPEVAFGLDESQVEYAATDGATTARAILNIVRAGADFEPKTGNPRTMRVRHTVSGFGLSLTRPSVYLHYVSPAAQRAAKSTPSTSPAAKNKSTAGGSAGIAANQPGVYTRRIGLLRGPCGVLKTSPRKLFPFRATKGKWELQYDTNPRYTRGVPSSHFYWVRKNVTIK